MSRLETLCGQPDAVYSKPARIKYWTAQIDSLAEQMKPLGLPTSIKKAKDIRTYLNMEPENKAATAHLIKGGIDELRDRLATELEGKMFYAFYTNVELLDSKEPLFGKPVEDAFPKASEDISEAGKCLALDRPTACGFHLMRAMERAVQALYTAMGLTGDPEREWGKLLSDIEGAIEKMPKGDTRNDWSAAHTHLYHVKQAWRNDVMHPKQTYTPEEAKAVFDAVRSFMQHLAKLIMLWKPA